jgi:DNA-binding NarL/FixJ family response regulator
LRPYKILVAEDSEPFRQFIRSELGKRADLQVAEVCDGLSAFETAQDQQPDLILLDIGLPGLNGIAVGKRVRKVLPSAKILFLSLESSPDVVREALSLGACGYVSKSHAHTDLLLALERVLSGERFVSSRLKSREKRHDTLSRAHEVLFCFDEATLLDSLSRFVAAALNAGNPALVVATEPHRKHLLQDLRAKTDIDAAIKRGVYVDRNADAEVELIDVLETIRELCEAAIRSGKTNPRVAVCGERAGRLWASGRVDEAIRLERLCRQLLEIPHLDLLCVYPLLQGSDGEDGFMSICAEHATVSFR